MTRNKLHGMKHQYKRAHGTEQSVVTFDNSLRQELTCYECCSDRNLSPELLSFITYPEVSNPNNSPALSNPISSVPKQHGGNKIFNKDLSPASVILLKSFDTNEDSENEDVRLPYDQADNADENDNQNEKIARKPLHRKASVSLVRSVFHVKGICCASEVPIVKKIARQAAAETSLIHNGYVANDVIKSVQINIATKQIYLKHLAEILPAETIAKHWTDAGFTATVIKSEIETIEDSSEGIGVSIFQVTFEGTVAPPDMQMKLEAKLSRVCKGFDSIASFEITPGDPNDVSGSDDFSTRVTVSIRHDTCLLTVLDLEMTLVEIFRMIIFEGSKTQSVHITIIQDAQTEIATRVACTFMQQIQRASFVESTFRQQQTREDVNDTTALSQKYWENILRENFDATKARAIRVSNIHNMLYLKIEHNPQNLSAKSLVTVLSENASGVFDVIVDGEIEKIFLPNNIRSHGNQQSNSNAQSKEEGNDIKNVLVHANNLSVGLNERLPKLHVVFSGIFWIVALISAIRHHEDLLRFSGFLSVLFGLPPVAIKAIRTIQRFQFDANCMMLIASVGAFILEEYDEAASVSFLFALSEFLESRASARARNALSEMISLCPEYAHVIHPITKQVCVVLAEDVPLYSHISIRTGDKIPVDGVVIEGTSLVDQSSLTGESLPLTVTVNSFVSSGCVNIGESPLIVRTTARMNDSAVCRLVRLIEEASLNRSPTEKMIDALAMAYTPVVVTIAVLMSTISWFFGSEIGHYWTSNGLIVIVIACPCALTISTPVTYTAGLAATAKSGILVKDGSSLEALGLVDQIVFDKTGTITEGIFQVSELESNGHMYSRSEMLSLLALVESPSSHPLSSALVKAARAEGVSRYHNMKMENHSVLKGEGVTALVDNKRVFVGNQRLFDRIGMHDSLSISVKERVQKWSSEGGTVGFIGVEGEGVIGFYSLIDTIRPEAKDTIEELQKMGMSVLMLTGDGEGAAKRVAEQVGIPLGLVHAKLLPEDKVDSVIRLQGAMPDQNVTLCPWLQRKRHHHSKVLFVGDGINDVAAMATADIGVSMGHGAAVALEMSDVTLIDCNLSKLVYAVEMGSKVVRTIQQNIVLSFLCKIVVVVLTFSGHMTLLYAIASDVGVMLLVTMNGMKLLDDRAISPPSKKQFATTSTDDVNKNKFVQSPNIGDCCLISSKASSCDHESQIPITNEFEALIARDESSPEIGMV